MARKRGIMLARVKPSRKRTADWEGARTLAARYRTASKAKLLAENPYSLEKDGVTQSLLGSYLDCPERCRQSLDGYQPLVTKDSLVYGTLFHWLLELLANAIRKGTIRPRDADAFFEHHIKTWMHRTLRDDRVDPQRAEFIAAQAKAVFAPYCLYWAEEDFVKSRWMEVEGVFDTQWTGKLLGRIVRLRGRRDGVGRYKGKRETIFRLNENKTKKQVPQRLEDALLIDFQNQFYLTAANNDLAKLGLKKPIREVMYNIIRRPNLKLGKSETLADYTSRVRADIEKDDKRRDHYFKRTKLIYTAAELKRFAEDLERKVASFADWLDGGNPHSFHRNERQCMRGFVCTYLSACTTRTMNEYKRDGRLFEELFD